MCINLPVLGFCDDGLWCNGEELCDPLQDCQPGTPPVCTDGVDCTDDTCDEDEDQCSFPVLPGMCRIAGDCLLDGDDQPGNPCLACLSSDSASEWSPRPAGYVCGESVCLDGWYTEAPTCDGAGNCVETGAVPCQAGCADEENCTEVVPDGVLRVSKGAATDPEIVVRRGEPAVVLRLQVSVENLDAALTGLRLTFPGPEEVDDYWRALMVNLHEDTDMDDLLDDGSEPVGVGRLDSGEVLLSNLGVRVNQGETRHLLVELLVAGPESVPSGGCGTTGRSWPQFLVFLPLLILLLIGTKRRPWRVVIALILLFCATFSCSRYGYYPSQLQASRAIRFQSTCRGESMDSNSGCQYNPYVPYSSRERVQ
jgi:hypothetical protein